MGNAHRLGERPLCGVVQPCAHTGRQALKETFGLKAQRVEKIKPERSRPRIAPHEPFHFGMWVHHRRGGF